MIVERRPGRPSFLEVEAENAAGEMLLQRICTCEAAAVAVAHQSTAREKKKKIQCSLFTGCKLRVAMLHSLQRTNASHSAILPCLKHRKKVLSPGHQKESTYRLLETSSFSLCLSHLLALRLFRVHGCLHSLTTTTIRSNSNSLIATNCSRYQRLASPRSALVPHSCPLLITIFSRSSTAAIDCNRPSAADTVLIVIIITITTTTTTTAIETSESPVSNLNFNYYSLA